MTEYVLGFAFSAHLERVLLIRKNRPKWQMGKLNGLGGHIESESKYVAMVREFKEECGCDTTEQQWSYFCRMDGVDFTVHCFSTIADLLMCKTTTSERVEIILVNEIKNLRLEMIENLPWLIYLAVDHLQDGRPNFTVSDYGPTPPLTDATPATSAP